MSKTIKETVNVRVAIAMSERGFWVSYDTGLMGSSDPRDDSHILGHARQLLIETEKLSKEESDKIRTFILSAEIDIKYDLTDADIKLQDHIDDIISSRKDTNV